MGYDYLALYVFIKRGSVKRVIGKVGVGKESGIPLFPPNQLFFRHLQSRNGNGRNRYPETGSPGAYLFHDNKKQTGLSVAPKELLLAVSEQAGQCQGVSAHADAV